MNKFIAVIRMNKEILSVLHSFFEKDKIADHKHTEDFFYGFDKNGNKIIIRVSKYFKGMKEPRGFLIVRRKYSKAFKSLRIDYLFGDEAKDFNEVFNFEVSFLNEEVKDATKEQV